jgi:hypothetical protein
MRIQTLTPALHIFPLLFTKKALGAALLTSFLFGCAGIGSRAVMIGEPESGVISKLGNPHHIYQDGSSRLLEYKTGPWGQRTYMARISPDGKLVSYEQVLTNDKFASIIVGSATKEDVLRRVGSPSETSYLSLKDLEVWSYPYKESDTWNSVMHVHFDRRGIVHSLQNGPDLRFDRDGLFPFGMMGL